MDSRENIKYTPYHDGRPVGFLFFWSVIFISGVVLLHQLPMFGFNTLIFIFGVLMTVVGGFFSAGTFWLCIRGKKTYGDVKDLV
jgi:hypothetical protein